MTASPVIELTVWWMESLVIGRFLDSVVLSCRLEGYYLPEKKKSDILDKAHSSIILCLGDKVLREVAGERYRRNLNFSIRQSLQPTDSI